MIGYIIRRIAIAIVVVFGVIVISFLLLHLLSPSPVYAVLGAKAQPLAVKQWNLQHGYDRPEIDQFFTYVGNLIGGNFGYSYKLDQSVTALFKEDAPRSVYLSGCALLLSLVIAIPLGVAQAVRRNRIDDYMVTSLNFIFYSMPVFFLGLILIQFFALDWGIFPPVVSDNVTTVFAAFTHPLQLTLPIVTLAAINVASFSRYVRSSAIDALAQDYIRLARAKGLSQRAVLTRHLLRNACLPMITLVGLSMPLLIAGNLLIEYLFNYSGIGLLFFNALGNLDYNILLAYVIAGGVLTVLGNLIADVAVATADPRIRLG